MFVANYGAEGSRPLGLASRGFLENPPEGSVDAPILSDRGLLWISDETRLDRLRTIAAEGDALGAGSVLVDSDEILRLVPKLRPDRIAGGLYEPNALDIDVAALHQAFVRIARKAGAELRVSSPVTGLARLAQGWRISTPDGEIECTAVVNASGAWGDVLARLAGIEPVGLQPLRRTAFMVPGDHAYARWPFVVDVDQLFYFRPDGAQLLCSLAEETPSPPARPQARHRRRRSRHRKDQRGNHPRHQVGELAMDRVAHLRTGPGNGHRRGADRARLLLAGGSGWHRHPDRPRLWRPRSQPGARLRPSS